MSATASASFTCPICLRVSHHPRDGEERYCAIHGFVDDVLADPLRRKDLVEHRDLGRLCVPSVADRNGTHRVGTFDGRCRLTMRWLARPRQWADWEGNLYTPKDMVILGFQYLEEFIEADLPVPR